MSEMEEYRSYSHLRANVPRRRFAYKTFLWIAFVVFILSIVDIIWLDEMLFWGVVGAYVLLFIWGLLLLISRRISDEEALRLALGEAALHCPHCSNVFFYAADHTDDPQGTSLTCPVCGVDSRLPAAHSEPDEVTMPTGNRHKAAYECNNCAEHVLITTIGAAPRAVRFDACPNCHYPGTMEHTALPEDADIRPIKDWTAA